MTSLQDALAPRIVPVVLASLTTRYPFHDAHRIREGELPRDPTQVHPAFGNSFDWHSSVHSHWTALQLLQHFISRAGDAPPELPALEAAVARNLAAANVAAETAYLAEHPSYERPYGWGWAMLLAASARTTALRGMAERIAEATAAWLERMPEPVRHGVHSNTAFALSLMLEASQALDLPELERAIALRAREWFEGDRDWPERWERSGHDFLSPGLAQADLMRRILTPDAFAQWFGAFLPALSPQSRILSPANVPSGADGQIVHLHGLNLSRAAMAARIARALRDGALLQQAHLLYAASAEQAVCGDYLATHWLATFAWDAAVSLDGASSFDYGASRLRSG